jgi:hypothetical protein
MRRLIESRRRVPQWISILPVVLLFSSITTSGQTKTDVARKFDEFGDIQSSDLKARLDNFAIQLQNEPATKGFIVVYRTRRDLPGLNNAIAFRSKDYLIDSRGVARDKIVTVDGGEADCEVQELWIVPIGTTPTPRPDAYQRYFPDYDSPRKIDEYGFDVPNRNRRPDSRLDGEEKTEYLETFAMQLKRQLRTTACVIVYALYNPRPGLDDDGDYEPVRDVRLDPPGVARSRLKLERNRLIKEYGISASRIRLINGGYRKRRMVELWIVPRGEHAPIPTPNSFPPRTRKKQ